MKLVVQISDKHGERLQRLDSNLTKIKFGRGWDNDVIIQDKYVDPHHFNLQIEDGAARLIQTGTTNGTQIEGNSLEREVVDYRYGDSVKIGDTRLKIFDSSQPVVPTTQRSPWFFRVQQIRSGYGLAGLTVMAVITAVLFAWGFETEPFTRSVAMVEVFSTLLVLLMWSLACGFISKLVRHESNFFIHWAIGCIGFVTLHVVSLLVNITRFNLQQQLAGEIVASLAYGLIGTMLLYAVFSYTTFWQPRLRMLWSGSCVLAVLAVAYSSYYLQEDHERWSARTNTEQATYPPALLVRSDVTVEQYVQELESLFDFEDQL